MGHSRLRLWAAAVAAMPLAAHANTGIGFFFPASLTLVLAFISAKEAR